MPDGKPAQTESQRTGDRPARRGGPAGDLGTVTPEARLRGGHPSETWEARLDDGRRVAATMVQPSSAAARRRLLQTVASLRDVRSDELVPVLGAAPTGEDGALWAVAELDDGVPLRRLLAVAELNAGQTHAVLRSTLLALEALEQAGWSHGAVHAGNVHVSAAGAVRLDTTLAAAARVTPERTRRDLEGVTALLGSMLPRRRAGAAVNGLAGWLRELGDSERLSGCASAAAARSLVDSESPAAGADRVGSELAALVAALHAPIRRAESSAPAVVQPAQAAPVRQHEKPVPAVSRKPDAAWASRRAYTSSAGRPGRFAILAGAIGGAAVLVLVVAAMALRGDGGASTGSARSVAPPPASHAAPTPAKPPPAAAPAALPVFGPASTTTIASVTMPVPVGPCAVTSPSCVVTVRVVLRPHGLETVAWNLEVVDRCTGAAVRQTGPTVRAISSYQYVYDKSTITLPATKAVAVIAVTAAPSVAESPPLTLGPATC